LALLPEDLVQRRITFTFDYTILSIVSENVYSHVVPKLKMDILAIVCMGDFDGKKTDIAFHRFLSDIHINTVHVCYKCDVTLARMI